MLAKRWREPVVLFEKKKKKNGVRKRKEKRKKKKEKRKKKKEKRKKKKEKRKKKKKKKKKLKELFHNIVISKKEIIFYLLLFEKHKNFLNQRSHQQRAPYVLFCEKKKKEKKVR